MPTRPVAARRAWNGRGVFRRAGHYDGRRWTTSQRPPPLEGGQLTSRAIFGDRGRWQLAVGAGEEGLNRCLDYLRSPRSRASAADSLALAEAARREPASDIPTTAERRPPLSVEQSAVQAEMSECVQRFVLSLPETLRTPLILHDMQGLTNGEIAQVLCCSLEAAKMRFHRGRERLRQMMEERCDLYHDERNVLACLPTSKRSSADG